MSVQRVSQAPPGSQLDNDACLQKPLTKAAIFVIAFLLAVAAVGAHFGGLGIPGIVAFSAASGVCLVAGLIVTFFCRSSENGGTSSGNTKTTNGDLELLQSIPEDIDSCPIAEKVKALKTVKELG